MRYTPIVSYYSAKTPVKKWDSSYAQRFSTDVSISILSMPVFKHLFPNIQRTEPMPPYPDLNQLEKRLANGRVIETLTCPAELLLRRFGVMRLEECPEGSGDNDVQPAWTLIEEDGVSRFVNTWDLVFATVYYTNYGRKVYVTRCLNENYALVRPFLTSSDKEFIIRIGLLSETPFTSS